MGTTSYRRQIPPVSYTIKFATGYRHACYGGVAGFIHWLGHVFVVMILMSFLSSAFVPQEYLDTSCSWLTLAILTLFIATLALGARIIERRKRRARPQLN